MALTAPEPPSEHVGSVSAQSAVAARKTLRGPLSYVRRPRVAAALTLVLGALVFLPSIRSPFWLDDYLHIGMIEGTFPSRRSAFDLYNFASDTDRGLLVERGLLPWWTAPRLTLRFFRPLSSALLWADHRLFGHSALLMHLHSLLWWVLAVLAARALFRRAFSTRVTFIATLVFALAPSHAIPLAWLANREVLISLALGTVGLIAHVRWREERRWQDGALAFVSFTLALLGGEYAVCFGGYVLALELVRRGEGIGRRALGTLPFVLPAAAYLAVRAALEYGTADSGMYRDPFVDPRGFLVAAPRRLVTLLANVWVSPGTEELMPVWLLGILVCIAVIFLVRPFRRALAELNTDSRRAATWLLLGSIFAFGPLLAVATSVRVIGISMLGAAPAVAVLLDYAWFGKPPGLESARLAALLLGFAHLVHGPASAAIGSYALRDAAVQFASRSKWLWDNAPEVTTKDVVVIRGTWQTLLFGPFAADPRARPPARWRFLANTGHVLVLRRDARTIELVVPPGKSLFPTGPDDLFRRDETPWRAGFETSVPGMEVTVLDVGEAGPTRVRFTFDRDLDDPRFVWIAEENAGYKEAKPPEPGFGSPFDP